ncbi:hypothetical protein AAMO2058_000369400 [Amorphochlora amoebiformis]
MENGSSKPEDEGKAHREVLKENGFTEDDLEDLKAAFRLFDKNKDGHISVIELKEVFRTIGIEPSESEFKSMMADAKANSDGDIDFKEFVRMVMTQMENAGSMQSLDNEDFISVAELKHVMESLGEELSESDLQEMIEEADINGDGKLNYKEFVAMIVQSIT